MSFALRETDIYSPCHTYGCHNRAIYWLGKADSPNGTVPYVCQECADELKASILAEKAEEVPFEEPFNYEEMTVSDLKAIAEADGHTGLSKKTKSELIALLQGEK